MNDLSRVLAFSVALILGLPVGAATTKKQTPICGPIFSTEELDALKRVAKAAQDQTGLGNRRAMGSYPANTPANATYLADHGVKWWGYRIYVFDHGTTEKEISEFHAHIIDRILRSTYLILPPGITKAQVFTAFNRDRHTPDDADYTVLKKALSEGKLWDLIDSDSPNGALEAPVSVEAVDGNRIIDEMDLTALRRAVDATERWSGEPGKSAINNASDFEFLVVPAWVAPIIEGQLHTQNLLDEIADGNNIRRLLNRWNRIAHLFDVGFDLNFPDFLHAAANNYRRSTGSSTSNNQSSPAAQAAELQRFEAGIGHSFEIRLKETGEIIAGVLIHSDGNWLSLKTPVYDPYYRADEKGQRAFGIKNPKNGQEEFVAIDRVDLGKIAAMLLHDWLYENGIPVTDVGMVTPFTRRIHGTYYPRAQAQAMGQPFRKPTQVLKLGGLIEDPTFVELAHVAYDELDRSRQTWSDRGASGNRVRTEIERAELLKQGWDFWNMRLFHVPSDFTDDQVLAYDRNFANPGQKGIYFRFHDEKTQSAYLAAAQAKKSDQAASLLKEAFANQKVDLMNVRSGNLSAIDRIEFSRRFNWTGLRLVSSPVEQKDGSHPVMSFFGLPAWVKPLKGAVLKYDDVVSAWNGMRNHRNRWMRIATQPIQSLKISIDREKTPRSLWWKRYGVNRQGQSYGPGQIVTSTSKNLRDFKFSLEQRLAKQRREGKSGSDYDTPEAIRKEIALYKEGKATFLDTYYLGEDGTKILLFGFLVHNIDGKITAPSPYYMEKEYVLEFDLQTDGKQALKGGLNLARYSATLLSQWLHSQGIDAIDIEMVTPLTASLGGKYVDRNEAKSAFKTGAKAAKALTLKTYRGGSMLPETK